MDGATNGGIHDLVKKNHGRSVAHIDFLPFQGYVSCNLSPEH